jgi:chromosome segregation ATPase
LNSEDISEFITITEASKIFQRTRQAIDLLIKQNKVESKRVGARATIMVHKPTLQNIYAKIEMKRSEASAINSMKEHIKVESEASSEVLQAQIKGLNKIIELHEASIVNLKEEKLMLERKLQRLEEKNDTLQQELVKISKEMHAFINNESGMFNFGKLKDTLFSKKK